MSLLHRQHIPAFAPDNMLTHVLIKLMDHQNLKKGGKASPRVVWDLKMKKLWKEVQ